VRPLALKVLYPTTELAESIGITRHMLFELLRTQGIVVYQFDRVTLVPLSEIKDKLEPVWDAICLAEKARSRGAS
jgi:hypothetical protein